MKKILVLVLFALVSVVSYSQVSWNAKVGLNLSNLSGDGFNMKVGYQVGLGMECAFSQMWSIRPSLMYTTKGGQGSDSGADISMNFNYLEMPVMLAASFTVADKQNIVVKAGPYLAYAVGGNVKMEQNGVSVSVDGIFDKDSDFSQQLGGAAARFDAGLGIGIAYETGKFFIDLTGEFGLLNIYDIKNATYGTMTTKNSNFSLGVGYKF